MSEQHHRAPTEIDHHRSWFDELGARTQDVISRDVFFIALVVLTALWVPSLVLFDSVDHWYLALAAPADVITLFIVALLANHDRRSDQALQRKANALAAALAAIAEDSPNEKVRRHAPELRAAYGLEERESTDG